MARKEGMIRKGESKQKRLKREINIRKEINIREEMARYKNGSERNGYTSHLGQNNHQRQ